MYKRRFINIKKNIRKILPSFLDLRFRKLKKIFYYFKLFKFIDDIRTRKKIEINQLFPVPPSYLRTRVGAANDVEEFLNQGEICFNDINNSLIKIGYDLQNFNTILDFGCGCGRTVRWFDNWAKVKDHSIIGVDIDKELIKWCNNNINILSGIVSEVIPPLPFDNNKFDLLYSISVFSHLNEPMHLDWLKELNRIMKDKGICLISVHGHYCYDFYSRGIHMEALHKHIDIENHNSFVQELYDKKFIFDLIDKKTKYGNTFIAPEYINDKWSKYFKVIDILPLGMTRLQDLVILQKDNN